MIHYALCSGERKEVEWAFKKIEENVKIVDLEKLKKHFGIIYDWKQDKLGNNCLEASMPQMVDEISEKFEKARGKKPRYMRLQERQGKL
jgi:hypothetical protein